MFKNNTRLYLTNFNLFIFFKFLPLNDIDMISKIILTLGDMPLMGMVTINENMNVSKINKDYLTPLFLQQFIRILGFHGPSTFNKMNLKE